MAKTRAKRKGNPFGLMGLGLLLLAMDYARNRASIVATQGWY